MGISQKLYLQEHKYNRNITASLRREELKKKYSVEVQGICACPGVSANSPMEALIIALRNSGYTATKDNIRPIKGGTRTQLRVCKVCLLGGTRESVSYYEFG